eukprot:4034773-Prymnesium_polylepis.1
MSLARPQPASDCVTARAGPLRHRAPVRCAALHAAARAPRRSARRLERQRDPRRRARCDPGRAAICARAAEPKHTAAAFGAAA